MGKRSKAKRLRALVVDDNPSNQEVVSLLLESEGVSPETARSGQEALEMMERSAYDVVFLDVRMPDMDGLETVREARKRWPRSRPWLIALTACDTRQDRARCLAAGMDDFVPKPLSLDSLVAALRHVPRRAS